MDTPGVADRLAELCRGGQMHAALDELYDPGIVSHEMMGSPEMAQDIVGIADVKRKNEWWMNNHEVHRSTVSDPVVAGNHFCVKFEFDVTHKPSGQRMTLQELAVYEVKDGKIVDERFYYDPPDAGGDGDAQS